jgi:multidrug efflux pump subunit AcrB
MSDENSRNNDPDTPETPEPQESPESTPSAEESMETPVQTTPESTATPAPTPDSEPRPEEVHKGGIIAWFTRNPVAANLLMAIILLAGIFSAFTIRKEFFPNFSLDRVIIQVPYLGAAPEEVEEGVLIKIEEAIQDLEGIEEIVSTAREGMGDVRVEVATGYDPLTLLDRIKVRVDAIATFPDETEKPVIFEQIIERDAIRVQLYGNADEATLKEYGKLVRDEILELPSVTRADLQGTRDYEISIEVSEEQLREYGLTFNQVVRAVQDSSVDLPAGSIKTAGGDILLRGKGQAYRQQEFEDLVLLTRQDGTRLLLGDIATVRDAFADTTNFMRYNGKPSVSIGVFRVGDQNLLDIAQQVRDYVEEKSYTLPEGLEIDYWADQSRLLKGRIDLMLKNGAFGAILVFLMLTLFLRLRVAFFVMLGLPVSFLGTLALMPTDPVGISINMITLFGFIVVLGIVVDDAIVVGENVYTTVRRDGQSVLNVIRGAEEVAVPVTFGVLTTIAAFMPILFIPGTDGKIWSNIGIVVILCLLFSLVESKLILPAHLASIRLYSPVEKKPGFFTRFQRYFADGLHKFVDKYYRPVQRVAMENRYVTLALFLFLIFVTAGLVRGGLVRFVFFPSVETDILSGNLTMREGTPEDVVEAASRKIERALWQADELMNPDRRLVEGLVAFTTGENKVMFIAEIIPSEERDDDEGSVMLVNKWRDLVGPIAGATELTFSGTIGHGGKPIDFQLQGDNVEQLNAAAEELKTVLAEYEGVFDISDSFTSGKQEIKLDILPRAEVLGLTLRDLGQQVRYAFYGAEAQRVQRGKDEVRVMVRYPEENRRGLGDLENMRIRAENGIEVPFQEVADAEFGRGYAVITRKDRSRTVDVTADVDKSKKEPGAIISDIQENQLPELLERYPDVQVSLAGESEDQQASLTAMLNGFFIVLFIIYALMAIPLKSYGKPLLIMMVIPFGIIGAVFGHLLLGLPISILSLCGIIALSGVVINDGIVMVDFINKREARGLTYLEAVNEAGAARFRAILLTSLTTFFGLLPMVTEQSLQAQFLIPMAVSLAFGILFSTVITLVLLPALYLILMDITGKSVHDKNQSAIDATTRDITQTTYPGENPAQPQPTT